MPEARPDLFHLRNRVAVVTGGCGQLGQQFCAALASHGARVVALDVVRQPEASLDLFEQEQRSGRLVVRRCDITVRAELEAALAQIAAEWETPSILVNSAGIDSPPDAPAAENGPFEDYALESLDRVLSVNVK